MFVRSILTIVATVSLCAQSTFALPATQAKGIEKEVLQLLLTESESITLVDSNNEKKLSSENQLSSLLIAHLSEIPSINGQSSVVLKHVSVQCKVAPKPNAASQTYMCRLDLSKNDYTVNGNQIDIGGAKPKSRISIEVLVSKEVNPKSKPVLKSKTLKASLIGG